MRKFWISLRTILIAILLLSVIVGLGVLVYFAGTFGLSLPDATRLVEAPLSVSPVPTLEEAPLERFGRIDPAIVEVLDYRPSNYGSGDLSIFDIQPVGIYIPRTGEPQFQPAAPTATPTPLPYPTSPPLPVPPTAAMPPTVGVAVVPQQPSLTPMLLPPPSPAPTIAEVAPDPDVPPPLPTPIAYPTSPAVPQQPLSPLPTLVPGRESRTLPYGGDDCAPAGNPVEGLLTQRYHRYHLGIDIGVSSNTPVLATHSGTVLYADWSDIGYGYVVIVQNGRYITYYAHVNSFNVAVGDSIGKGSIVAWSGSSGNSSGPHVHYEIRIDDIPVDPLTFASRGLASC